MLNPVDIFSAANWNNLNFNKNIDIKKIYKRTPIFLDLIELDNKIKTKIKIVSKRKYQNKLPYRNYKFSGQNADHDIKLNNLGQALQQKPKQNYMQTFTEKNSEDNLLELKEDQENTKIINLEVEHEYKPIPPYPEDARRAGIEGEVLIKISTNESGKVEKIEIQKSTGYPILDQAALNTLRTWQLNSKQVALIPVVFRLNTY